MSNNGLDQSVVFYLYVMFLLGKNTTLRRTVSFVSEGKKTAFQDSVVLIQLNVIAFVSTNLI